jgi:hypothetical protein
MFTRKASTTSIKSIKREQSLKRACQYSAQFWSDILRLNLLNTRMQTFTQELAARTNPLSHKFINRFQVTLETYIYNELSLLEDYEVKDNGIDFQRWVGCYEYGPNTYLAEVAESFSISPLHFPPQTGCYIFPGRVIRISGEVRYVN